MRSRRDIPVNNIGIAMLITVFIVVSMMILSLLAVTTASRDYEYSEKLAEHSTEYFNASNTCQRQIAMIAKEWQNGTRDHFTRIDGIEEFTIKGNTVTLAASINDKQKLSVLLELGDGEQSVTIKSYAEVQKDEWNGDRHLNVMGSDN